MKPIFTGRTRSEVIGVVLVAAASAVSWFAWMGWDRGYQLDRATGKWSGPYEAWQVLGCAASLLVLLVAALSAGVRPLPASAALTLAFTAAWTVQAAGSDETGLYTVGMLMLLVGLAVATTVVSAVTLLLRGWWAARRRS
jgi:hypothetical protein